MLRRRIIGLYDSGNPHTGGLTLPSDNRLKYLLIPAQHSEFVIMDYTEQNAQLEHAYVCSKIPRGMVEPNLELLAQSLANLENVCVDEDLSYTVHEVMPSFQEWLSSEPSMLLGPGMYLIHLQAIEAEHGDSDDFVPTCLPP